jgi:hypothetical protein
MMRWGTNLAPFTVKREGALTLQLSGIPGTSMNSGPEITRTSSSSTAHLIPTSRASHPNLGYSLFSLTRASAVLNCQLALAWCLLR